MYTKKEAELDLDLIKERLIDFEGMVLKPYHCSENYLTIGVGRNLENNGINEEEALKWLNAAIENGYNNWESIKSDKYLQTIRDTSEYKTIVQKAGETVALSGTEHDGA